MPALAPPLASQSFRPVVPPKTLTDDTPVSIVFRGGPAIVDKWDGQDVYLPLDANQNRLAGDELWASRYYEAVQIDGVPWAVAKHIRSRAIVPGTRDPRDTSSRKAVYQIAILKTPNGLEQDKASDCEPLSEVYLKKFEDCAEGIDRSVFLDSRKHAKTLDTMASISHVGNVEETLNAAPTTEDLTPDPDHEALKTIRQDQLAYEGAGGHDASDTRRANRGRR